MQKGDHQTEFAQLADFREYKMIGIGKVVDAFFVRLPLH